MFWDKLCDFFIYLGMPVVLGYHLTCSNVFLNTSATDATGLEKAGNYVLTPVHYLLCGKKAVLENGEYKLEQRFDYEEYFGLKTTAALVTFPFALPLGSALKGASFLFEGTQKRHNQILAAATSSEIKLNQDYYASIGLRAKEIGPSIDPPRYFRKPGEENIIQLEKNLLKEIAHLLKKHNIPFWVDCGTCMGAYRYWGVIPWDNDIDIAVLEPDFDNVMHALQALDTKKYHVQDWSNRSRPKTYIRVYIKENHNHLDIYHFRIDPKKQTLTHILSNDVSVFMLDSWKIRERRFCIPTPFEMVFPLKTVVFDGIEVFAPNQIEKYLQQRYGENLSPVYVYSEISQKYEKDLNHPYWLLPHVK